MRYLANSTANSLEERKMKRSIALLLALMLVAVLAPTALAQEETTILLSNDGILVNGTTAPTDSAAAVYVGAEIVYYKAGQGTSYGEGTSVDEHSEAEAALHTVVTITQPGSYRISGTISYGQIAIDLGSDAEEDPSAVVELILDGIDITCTVAPAIIFYNVYNETDANAVSAGSAGSIVTLADGSTNTVDGSYVARIYKEGTTKKLHKYDGALYSKKSMVVRAETAGTGELTIIAENEGLDSELHMAMNGGNYNITAQNDGINVNEDGVSHFFMNAGYLCVNAGLGAEGDGVDSNGFLTITGGTIVSFANGQSGDGGIDADNDIVINGGTVIAFGTRNDAVAKNSAQAYMELSYSTTKAAGTIVSIFEKSSGIPILIVKPLKSYQSFTYSSASLQDGSTYYVCSGGTIHNGTEKDGVYDLAKAISFSGATQQQYSGNSNPGGGGRPGGSTSGSTDFTLATNSHTFSGVSNATNPTFVGSYTDDGPSKTEISFTINNDTGMADYTIDDIPPLSYEASEAVPPADVQLTVTDVPSENYYTTAYGNNSALSALLPTEPGTYELTIAVVDTNPDYYGSATWYFSVTEVTDTETLLGDANLDEHITASDAALILRCLAGLDAELTGQAALNADVDGDGQISASDAAPILRYLAGIIGEFGA